MTTGLMVHTDGSARPTSRSFAGWGMQGYLFEEVEPTKGTGNPDYVLTADDYMSKVEKAINVVTPLVTPLFYVDGYGSLPPVSTNNAAELLGVSSALSLALEKAVDKVRIWSDSKYVVGGIEQAQKWRKNNWLKSDGGVPANLELWQDLLAIYDQLTANKIDVKISWCKGHNGNFGNEMADDMAFVGMRHATEGLTQSDIKLSEPSGYWKYESGRHPFITHRRMYYNSLEEYIKPGEYYIGEHDKDDDLAGKRMANGAYALVRMETPDPILELVRNYSVRKAEGENHIMLARLDYLYRSDVHEMLTNYGDIPMNLFRPNRLDTIIDDEKEPLIKQYNPPLLIQRTVNAISELGEILNDFLAKPHEMVTTDLTSLIYESIVETSKKGVEKCTNKLQDQFKVGVTDLETVANYRHPDGSVQQTNLKLILGLDLLDRNALRRLEEKHPTVTLVTWLEEPQAFRYAVIIKIDDAVGIWAATYSNLQIIQ